MKKSLNDLIEQSYKLSPDVDEESEAIGVLIASCNKSKERYISRFIRKNEVQKESERQYILRVMIKEIILQYCDIHNTENIKQITAYSNDIMFDVENFIIKSVGGQVVGEKPKEEPKNTESSKQTEQQDFLKTVFVTIVKFFKTIWNSITTYIKKLIYEC